MASESDVTIWTCAPGGGERLTARLAEALPAADHERIERLQVQERRAEAILASACLRNALSRRTGTHPLSLRFDSTCAHCGHPTHGKPRLPSSGVSFSLSHAAGLVAVAVSSAEVGLDVERIGSHDAGIALSEEERAGLSAVPAQQRDEAVLQLWTRKEAYLKGIGLGVVHDPALVTFVPAERGWSCVLDGGSKTLWHVRPFEPAAGWVGALAVEGRLREVRRETWSPGLLLDRDD